MSEPRTLVSGDVLAHRYELQDRVSERLGSATWRAHDRVLSRNVGVEMLASTDPRAEQFHAAARRSTVVTDPRFLRVLDLFEDHGQHVVIREWARAFPLDELLAQSSLPNHRASAVVAEVAEALAHAHELGIYHRRLSPHHVLLKQSGAVRIVGLGVASALAPVGHADTVEDLQAYERLDVEGLGKLLYACLVSRWPGAHIDQLRAAPTIHGRLLRPRQVRAGVSRDVDAVCDRVLGNPPHHHRTPLRSAADIARSLRLAGKDDDAPDEQPSLLNISSPDLLRSDPVIEPQGPPPGLEPPRRRPKAYEPAPPTSFERGKERAARATKGDRGLILLGVAVVLLLASILGLLVQRTTRDSDDPTRAATQVERPIMAQSVRDFDPQGEDGEENPDEVANVIDGKASTGWRTTTYFTSPRLGGLKQGVGVLIDLGASHELSQVRVRLAGDGTDLAVYTARPGVDRPTSLRGLVRRGGARDVGSDATFAMSDPVLTRYVVVWLTRLPPVPDEDGSYRGEIREVGLRGYS